MALRETNYATICPALSLKHNKYLLVSHARKILLLHTRNTLADAGRIIAKLSHSPNSEMEYCASAASMLAEEIWQIAEGFVEVLRKCAGSI